MEQPRTNAAACIIPMESEVIPNSPESKPIPDSTEFATKLPLKFDPLVVVNNTQRAAFERELMFKKIYVFIFVLITCSFYHVIGLLVTYTIFSWSHLTISASFLGVTISQLYLWPFVMSNLSEEDLTLIFNCILKSGLLGLLCALMWRIYKTILCAPNAIQQQNNPIN
ncbi:Hypothetical predicted protein [Cloeon dipterum]|uniref:Uncharacterized protein n=1 Tax=Cloeon dipterum TaxID=197152 RepID=A0A8S1DW43_9INSE|nr:Hypothetical predicted protein [Cloeon dipterum]